MNYDREIINLIGLETYKALNLLFPDNFENNYIIHRPLNDYYIQIVQQVITTTGYTGEELRNQLFLAVQKSKNNQNISNMIISPLFGSSSSPKYYASSFMVNAWWFLFISLLSIFLICIIIWIFQTYYPVEQRVPFFNQTCEFKKR